MSDIQTAKDILNVAKELHVFICTHLGHRSFVTEERKQEFDWSAPMRDGTLASFREEILDLEERITGIRKISIELPSDEGTVKDGD